METLSQKYDNLIATESAFDIWNNPDDYTEMKEYALNRDMDSNLSEGGELIHRTQQNANKFQIVYYVLLSITLLFILYPVIPYIILKAKKRKRKNHVIVKETRRV
ncbi:MAG: hypothetical protein EOM23_11825 [Candidatus Moranbacteria bacterium]|nr:hypothetical protein [Candidatus Moranbacteria bacterium]